MSATPIRRTLRTLIQLTAAGGFTGIVSAFATDLSPFRAALLLGLGTLAATWAQNALEAARAIPTILPTTPAPGHEDEPLPLVRPTSLAE